MSSSNREPFGRYCKFSVNEMSDSPWQALAIRVERLETALLQQPEMWQLLASGSE